MINGNEYAWEDIQLVVEGKAQPLEGHVEIKYTVEKEHTEIYGRGADPVRLGRGSKKYSATLTILQSELEAMQQSMPSGKDITDKAPFTITCAYAPLGGVEVVDQLTFCRIKKVEKGMKTGDGNMAVALDLAVGKILYNI